MNIRKGWTQYEDESLTEVVELLGTDDWTAVADMMTHKYDIKDRSGKKCRERWINHLKPDVSKSSWSAEETKTLFRCQSFYGNQWTEIAKFLPGRTDNSVKNFFYMTLRKKLRLFNKQACQEEKITVPINELSLNGELTQKVLKVDLSRKGAKNDVRRRSARIQENKSAAGTTLPKIICHEKIEDLNTFTSLRDEGISFDFSWYKSGDLMDVIR